LSHPNYSPFAFLDKKISRLESKSSIQEDILSNQTDLKGWLDIWLNLEDRIYTLTKTQTMIVERRSAGLTAQQSSPSVKFLVISSMNSSQEKKYQICLSIHNKGRSKVRLSDAQGKLLMEEQNPRASAFIIRDLSAGTYYFEVNDGFYYQVKELRISA